MSGPQYKMYFFPARGRGEVTRLIFKVAGVPLIEEIITEEKWPEVQPKMPTGHMPVLEIDGEMFPESNAIVRWAARKFGLAGGSDAEQLKVEEVLCAS